MQSSAEQLLVNIFAQMPFVLLIYYLYRNERDERVKAQAEQMQHLLDTISKNEERYKYSYDIAVKLYERHLDATVDQLKMERRARAGGSAVKTDLGDHPTTPKLGL
jgi:hypothetical protein